MDKFLDIIYTSQLADIEKGDVFLKTFAPFHEKLKELLSQKFYEEIEQLFVDYCIENNRFYAVEGMKLAIGIMDDTYIPKI